MRYHHKVLLLIFLHTQLNVFSQTVFTGNGVIDTEGNLYPSIVLGNGQEWMTTNLSANRFSDGTQLNYCEEQQIWSTSEFPCYAAYSNIITNAQNLGYLYNFYTIASDKNICPSGWRVPSELDWSKFSNYLGGFAVAGGKLKSTNSTHWLAPNIGATDEINFSAIGAGCRYNQGYFNNYSTYAFFWTSTELDGTWAWFRSLKNNSDELVRNFSKKQNGYSIRCMRDLEAGVIDNKAERIEIVPNPVIDKFEVLLNEELRNQIQYLKITDLFGKIVLLTHDNNMFLELHDVPKGIYFLEIISNNFNIKKRFIKI
jgi:uncharacterized protein (TIGR02145 family)